MDLLTIIPAAGLGGLASWGGQAISTYIKTRGDRVAQREDTEAALQQHTGKLALQLIQSAREEAAAARQEAAEARRNQIHFAHFDEAMEHLQAVLLADSPETRADAERRGHQFLTRMKRFTEAHGTVRNEVQVQRSSGKAENDLGEILRKGFGDE